jgi:hypothetical protein
MRFFQQSNETKYDQRVCCSLFLAGKDLGFFQYPTPTRCKTENLLGLPLYRGAGEVLKKLPKARVRERVKKPGFLKKPGF